MSTKIITSAQISFKVLVGEYYNPTSRNEHYCEIGVKNLQTGEMGVMVLCHDDDLSSVPPEVIDNANWIVSCFLPKELSHKSVFGKDACGKTNGVSFYRQKNILSVYLIGEHTEEIPIEKLTQTINIPSWLSRFAV